MIDLGDPLPDLAIKVTDSAGLPADAGSVTLTVTLPDGTTSTPTVAHDGVGAYSAVQMATVPGRYLISWVAAAPNACTFKDVRDVASADPAFLFSLEDARQMLQLPAADTAKDELIRTYIGAVTVVVEYVCGKQTRTSVTQTYDGGAAGILLPSNLFSVDTVVENDLTLTPNQDYTVDLRSCILYRGSPLAVFAFIPGIQNVTVTFTKGNTVIAPNVQLGAEMILRHFWNGSQQGLRPQFGTPDTSTGQNTKILGYLIPNAAMTLLQASPRQPGFA